MGHRKYIQLERMITNIGLELFSNCVNIEKSINEGLKEIGKRFKACRVYLHIYNKCPELNNNTYEWYNIGIKSKAIPDCVMKPLKMGTLYIKDESSSSVVISIKLEDINIGCLGVEFDDPQKAYDQDIVLILETFNKIITNIFDKIQKQRLLSSVGQELYDLFHHETDLVFANLVSEDGLLGPIIEVNDVACKLLGYSRDEMLSLSKTKLEKLVNIKDVKAVVDDILSTKPIYYEMVYYTKEGSPIPVETSIRFLKFDNQMLVITIARNITERKKIEQRLKENDEQLTMTLDKLKLAQKQLIQQEKLASIGQLAAGVAHEINNPLSYVSSNLETSREYFRDLRQMLVAYSNFTKHIEDVHSEDIDLEIQQLKAMEQSKDIEFIMNDLEVMLDETKEGLARINEIVTGLKCFARPDQDNELEEYNLNKGIQNSLIIANNKIKYHANVQMNLGNFANIQAQGNKIDQVLLNIILNASYAIKEKKSAEIGLITINTDLFCGYVRCQIEDNGIGINEKDMRKIFDPFYTTKPQGEGTGLGLSIAYEIVVNQHNGQLFVESTPDIGSKFTILLPIKQNNFEQVI